MRLPEVTFTAPLHSVTMRSLAGRSSRRLGLKAGGQDLLQEIERQAQSQKGVIDATQADIPAPAPATASDNNQQSTSAAQPQNTRDAAEQEMLTILIFLPLLYRSGAANTPLYKTLSKRLRKLQAMRTTRRKPGRWLAARNPFVTLAGDGIKDTQSTMPPQIVLKSAERADTSCKLSFEALPSAMSGNIQDEQWLRELERKACKQWAALMGKTGALK
jgi:hypothetical protein